MKKRKAKVFFLLWSFCHLSHLYLFSHSFYIHLYPPDASNHRYLYYCISQKKPHIKLMVNDFRHEILILSKERACCFKIILSVITQINYINKILVFCVLHKINLYSVIWLLPNQCILESLETKVL